MTSRRAPGIFFAMYSHGGHERLVLVADDDEGGYGDRRQPVDHARVRLREHAARRVREALRGRMMPHRLLHLAVPTAQRLEPALFELGGARPSALVPLLARFGVAIAGTRIADDQRLDRLGMREIELERHGPSER